MVPDPGPTADTSEPGRAGKRHRPKDIANPVAVIELDRRLRQVGLNPYQVGLLSGLHPPTVTWSLSHRRMTRRMFAGCIAVVEQREREVLANLLEIHWERG